MNGPDAPSLPLRPCYGDGRYRRRIRLRASEGRVRGRLQDDFHDFGVEIEHDGSRLRRIAGRDIRVPWTTCPAALASLEQLRGWTISGSLSELARRADLRSQCTHLFDLACLALRQAARQQLGAQAERGYDIEVPDRNKRRTRARLTRDGQALLNWLVEGTLILEAEPAHYSGRRLGGVAFGRFVERELDEEEAEAAFVLRRGVFIALGRRYDFDRIARAEHFAAVVGAACHTFRPEVVGGARRVIGSVRDWSDEPHGLFASLDEPADET